MKIMITGATSFVGNALIKELLNFNHDIIAVIRPNSKKANILPDCVTKLELEMNEYSYISKLSKCSIDALIHLAWDGTSKEGRNDAEVQKRNYENSKTIINEAVKLGCKKIIEAGSQAEYGLYNCEIFEDFICKPITYYGKEKLNFYNYMKDFCKPLNVSCIEVRIFSIYGLGDRENTLINSLTKKMLLNEDCELTEGTQLWNYLYIEDAAKAIRFLLEKNCDSGVYNLGSYDTRQLKGFIEDIKMLTKSESKLIFGKIPYSNTGCVSINPNINKIVKETGWKPEVSFKDGITYLINHFVLEEGL